MNECFQNVKMAVSGEGGQAINGWAIWEWPGVFIEAEFHSVWKSPDGSLICVSPREPDFPWMLFIPDPDREYEGFQIDNIRKPLKKSGLISRFIRNAEDIYVEMNKGDLKHFTGEITDPSPNLLRLLEQKKKLEESMASKFGKMLVLAIEDRQMSPMPRT